MPEDLAIARHPAMDELERRRRLRSGDLDRGEAPRKGGCGVLLPMSAHIAIPPDAAVEVLARPNKDMELLDLIVADAAGWLLEDVRVGDRRAEIPLPCSLGQLTRWLRQRGGHAWSRVGTGTEVRLLARRVDGDAYYRLCAAWVGRSTVAAVRPSLGVLGRMALWHPDPEPICVPCGKYAQVSARVPGVVPVLVEAVVLRRAVDWAVGDVRIDGRSCFSQEGDVPGIALDALAAHDLNLGVAAQDVSLVASYIGTDLGDQVLHADVLVAAIAVS